MEIYEVYYGETFIENENIEELQCLASFNFMDEAENFVFKHIKEHRQPFYYVRIAKGTTMRWYDYGSHTKFYVIKAIKNN